jgi:hypothetical protein
MPGVQFGQQIDMNNNRITELAAGAPAGLDTAPAISVQLT